MTMTPPFLPGAKLCELFYHEAVRPLLLEHFPDLKHSAALIGSGSDVLGFDDARSTDHDWGPRVMLFVAEADLAHAEPIKQVLAEHLPYDFRGYPTNFSEPDPNDNGTQLPQPITAGPINHRVTVQTVRSYLLDYLGFDLLHPLEPADWLTFSEQHLRALTGGAVFHDEVGLGAARARFAYYPRDVWLYLQAAGWTRLGQEDHLMGRAGQAGDEIGSALIGARLVRDVMRLCFLQARTYAPYPKWLGTAFKQLACAPALVPVLQAALRAATWPEREAALVVAYEHLAAGHNALGLTERLPEKVTSFFGRPFQVIGLHGHAGALLKLIEDPAVARLAARPIIGGLDLLSDNTDFVSNPSWRTWLRQLYQ